MQYNALESLQAFEMGTGQRKQREQETAMKGIGNALAGGDYGGASKAAFGTGDLNLGMSINQYGKGLEDAEQEKRRQAMMAAGMTLLRRTEGPERQQFVPQVLETLRMSGVEIPPEQLSQMDLSTKALEDTIAALQDPETLLAQYQKSQEPYTLGPNDTRLQGSEIVAQGQSQPSYKQVTTADGIYEYIEGQPDSMTFIGKAPEKSPLVQVGLGNGAQSLSQIPVGQPIPEDLLGGIKLPDDTYAVRANNAAGFEFATIPGSATARKTESGEQAKGGRTYTLGSLIGSYSTLAKNKAITARGNSTLDNAAAMYSGTGLGQTQDKLGGEVGNLANAEARDTIQGLSMKALMDMISMSDVSAKAMDSDAEMKAWLSAIKSDNYEAALTKLHVLDLSFGSGQELERAYADGTIDLNTYQYVTNRVNSDPMVKQMLDKADRYAALSGAVGQGNLTGGERQSMQDLSGLVAPDGSAVTEDDIQETMAATGMTREQIIARLGGR